MRPVSFIASALSVFVAAVVAIGWTGSAEIITVWSVEAVPLFDPETLAGKIGDLPKQVVCSKSAKSFQSWPALTENRISISTPRIKEERSQLENERQRFNYYAATPILGKWGP